MRRLAIQIRQRVLAVIARRSYLPVVRAEPANNQPQQKNHRHQRLRLPLNLSRPRRLRIHVPLVHGIHGIFLSFTARSRLPPDQNRLGASAAKPHLQMDPESLPLLAIRPIAFPPSAPPHGASLPRHIQSRKPAKSKLSRPRALPAIPTDARNSARSPSWPLGAP